MIKLYLCAVLIITNFTKLQQSYQGSCSLTTLITSSLLRIASYR